MKRSDYGFYKLDTQRHIFAEVIREQNFDTDNRDKPWVPVSNIKSINVTENQHSLSMEWTRDEPYKIIPGTGVYAVWVYWEDKCYKGMLHIGNRPTLENGDHITLEVNILGFDGDIYNNEITVAFIHHIRGNIKFQSLEELVRQLKKDRETVDQLLTKAD